MVAMARMDRHTVLDALRRHRAELEDKGFKHMAIFGSVARDEAHGHSDVDLLVELDRNKRLGLNYVGVIQRLEDILGCRVDVVTLPVRKERLRSAIERDRVDAF